jgi:hypothetical protein
MLRKGLRGACIELGCQTREKSKPEKRRAEEEDRMRSLKELVQGRAIAPIDLLKGRREAQLRGVIVQRPLNTTGWT